MYPFSTCPFIYISSHVRNLFSHVKPTNQHIIGLYNQEVQSQVKAKDTRNGISNLQRLRREKVQSDFACQWAECGLLSRIFVIARIQHIRKSASLELSELA